MGNVLQTSSLPDLHICVVRPGESGLCPKKMGSNNCMYSVSRCQCMGITETVVAGGQVHATRVECDSSFPGGVNSVDCLKQGVIFQRMNGIN